MRFTSLGLRLFLLSFASILLALVATTFVLNDQFNRYFEDRIYGELQRHLEQLTTNLSLSETGEVQVVGMQDQRFEAPFSGLYWQIKEDGGDSYYSQSLWGRGFRFSSAGDPGQIERATSKSPIGGGLLVVGWPILLGETNAERTLVLSVAIDDSEVTDASAGFRRFLIGWLGVMFAGLLVAAAVQVRLGLAPLQDLRTRIERIRSGRDTRLEGAFPREVRPLVDEVNDLLTLHEDTLGTARERASDLAHGLKTPLTVMRALATDLAEDGQTEKAGEIEAQIAAMHHFVERELARVKTSGDIVTTTQTAPVIERIARSIAKLPGGRDLAWGFDLQPEQTSPFDDHDLAELMGNILDNARKWAKSKVNITAGQDANGGWITVADDGPGIADTQLTAVLERGARLDDSAPGTGLGLTIAADLVAVKGANLTLGRADIGGLLVTISW